MNAGIGGTFRSAARYPGCHGPSKPARRSNQPAWTHTKHVVGHCPSTDAMRVQPSQQLNVPSADALTIRRAAGIPRAEMPPPP